MMNNIKKICYLHIGMHKTGTSSIQSGFYNARYTLKEKYDFYYYRDNKDSPENAFLSISMALAYANPKIDLPEFTTLNVHNDDKQKCYQHLCHILETESTIFISSEIIFTLGEEIAQIMNDFIVSYGFETKVIFYVRNPYDFISSGWQQRLKEGEILDFDKILFPNHIKRKYALWKDELTVRQFEREYLHHQNLLDDICTWLNKPEFRQYLHDSSENESLKRSAVIIGYNLLKNYPPYIHPDYGYDPLFAHTLNKLSEHSLNDDKFTLPKSVMEHPNVQKKIEEWITVLEEQTHKKYNYHSPELSDYDIGSLDSIDNKILLNIIRQVYLEHYQLSIDYHKHILKIEELQNYKDNITKVKFVDILKALFSKKRRNRLRRLRK